MMRGKIFRVRVEFMAFSEMMDASVESRKVYIRLDAPRRSMDAARRYGWPPSGGDRENMDIYQRMS
jgi:hypothetical protein